MRHTEAEKTFIHSLRNRDNALLKETLDKSPELASQTFHFKGSSVLALNYVIEEQWHAGLLTILPYISDIDMPNEEGLTGLHYASRFGNLKAVEALYNKGANLEKTDLKTGKTAFHYAAEYNSTDIIKFFINKAEENSNINFDDFLNSQTILGETALHFASDVNNHEVMDLLLSKNITINTVRLGGITPLHNASTHCDLYPIVKKMVDRGADVNRATNDKGVSSLCYSSGLNCVETSKYLIKHNAEVNHRTHIGKTPLHHAVFGGHTQSTLLLLQSGAKANVHDDRGVYPVHAAVIADNPLILSYLTAHRADIEVTHAGGQTPLMLGLEIGSIAASRYLVEQGARMDFARVTDGMGMGHAAAFGGNVQSVNFVYARNQKLIFNTNKHLGTAIHYAAANDQVKAIKYLSDLGLGLQLRDKMGFMPIHIAALNNKTEAVKFLIDVAGNPNQKTFLGLNTYQIASFAGATGVTTLLDTLPGIEKETILPWYSSLYYWFAKHIGDQVCQEYKAEDPFINELSTNVVDELETAALESGKNLLMSGFCKIHAIRALQFAKKITFTQDKCSENAATIDDYSGNAINVCASYDGTNSALSPTVKVILGITSIFGIREGGKLIYDSIYEYVHEYISFSHARTKAFKEAIWGAFIPESLLGCFDTYLPKLLYDVAKFGKWMVYENNFSPEQIIVKDVSELSDNYFYLAQSPATCAEKDRAAYNITNDDKVNFVCESKNYYLYSDYYGTAVDIATVAVPAASTIITCQAGIQRNLVTKIAACMGGVLVTAATAVTHFIAEIFTKHHDISLSQYYANKYVSDNSDEKDLYLAQSPATCAVDDKLVTQPLWYLGGDWSVCEENC
ncbi:MAG: ankyrin repeat domain-containing protein [Rickettsiales bacterium]